MKNIKLKDYSIYLYDQWSNFRELTKDYDNIIVLMDVKSKIYCYDEFRIKTGIGEHQTIVIPDKEGKCVSELDKKGSSRKLINCLEQFKNLETCSFIYERLMDLGADRHSLLINLGGGVVCDMGGFCAATFMRGFDFIQFPTTLLAQVDGSVGGKLGVNFKGIKNLIGLFKNPVGIFIYDRFLISLPDRELRSGFAEIVKHALILNYNLWQQIEKMEELKIEEMMPLIEKSIVIKKQIVQTDPLETGKRKILNFGHTLGHALETTYINRGLTIAHGEAVAAGMVMESFLSKEYYGHSDEWMEIIVHTLRKFFAKFEIDDDIEREMLDNIKLDKKNKRRQPSFALMIEIGNVEYDINLPDDKIVDSINYYRENY